MTSFFKTAAETITSLLQRKSTWETFRLSQQRLEGMFFGLRDAIVIVDAKTMRIVESNPAASQIFGYSRNELIGQTTAFLHVGEPSLEEFREHLYEAVQKKTFLSHLDFKMKRKDGTVFPTEHTVIPLKDDHGDLIAWVSVVCDITESKHAEEALRESEERYRAFVETVSDVIFSLSENGTITSLNLAFEKRTGWSRSEWIGKSFAGLLHPQDLPLIIEAFQKVIGGAPPPASEFRFLSKSGDYLTGELVASPQIKDGTVTGVCGIIRDVRGRKKLANELKESERKFRVLTETTASGILIHQGEKFLYANPAAETISGYTREELLSMNFWEIVHPDLYELVKERSQARQRGEKVPSRYELKIITKNGEERWVDMTVGLIDYEGKPAVLGTSFDITDRKRAEEDLRKSEEKYRFVVENAGEAILVTQGGMTRFANPKASEIIGYPKEVLTSRPFLEFIHPEDRGMVLERHTKRLRGERVPEVYPFRIMDGQGNVKWLETSVVLISWDNRPAALDFLTDVTERTKAEERLRLSEQRYRALSESAQDFIFIVDRNGEIQYVNTAGALAFGSFPEKIKGRNIRELFPQEIAERQKQNLQKVFESGNVFSSEQKTLFPSQELWLDTQLIPLGSEKGKITSVLGISRDMTERKRAEEALRESEERYRTILENIEDGYYETDLRGDLTFFNDSLCRMLGYSKDEMMGMSNKQYTDEENRKRLLQAFNDVYRTGKPAKGFDWQVIRKDGRKVFGEVSVSLVKDSEAHPIGFRGIARDITQRKQAEQALRTEKQRFQTLLGNAPFGMMMIDDKGDFKYLNTKFIELFGYGLHDVPNGKAWFRKAYPDPTYRHQVISTWINDSKSLEPGEKVPRIVTVTCKDGTEKMTRFITVKLETGENLVSAEDITERKRAEEERALLQEQLRQSQKMEAVGLLAGGIAHDFNNLLTVIKGYGQLSLLKLDGDSPLKRNIEEIQKGAERAANLTRQLLAFSRRQVMEMKVLNLNTLLMELKEMLHRVIGEDIELITRLSADLGRIKTDPGQFEQVILNLAVNARDAMPTGGKLIIETANVELDEAYAHSHVGVTTNPYVMLIISDTGSGMTPEVKGRIFEPFFTTKEKGRGTGLGLSTVYGIIKQSQGNIWAYSEPGHGTTFKIYLPRIEEDVSFLYHRGDNEFPKHGNETILLVEDELSLRSLAGQILRDHGYTVIEASNGEEALRLTEEHNGKAIHLLLTDVVMPQMSGKDLAERIKALRPSVKVLYTSGYTGDTIAHHGILEPDIDFLQKPFSPAMLTRKVREVLDE
jgi:PAS domain S-box-containing protein